MKKEYIKPSLLLLATEPSQILAGSQGGDGIVEGELGGAGGTGMEGDIDSEDDGADEGGSLSKGGLWDDLYW